MVDSAIRTIDIERILAALCRLARRRRLLRGCHVLLGVRPLQPWRLPGGAQSPLRLVGLVDLQRHHRLLPAHRRPGGVHQRCDRPSRTAAGGAGRCLLPLRLGGLARLRHRALAALRRLSLDGGGVGDDARRLHQQRLGPVVRSPARTCDQPGAQRCELRRHPGGAGAGDRHCGSRLCYRDGGRRRGDGGNSPPGDRRLDRSAAGASCGDIGRRLCARGGPLDATGARCAASRSGAWQDRSRWR